MDNPRKLLYAKLVGLKDKRYADIKNYTSKYSFTQFNEFLNDPDKVDKLYTQLSERGVVLDDFATFSDKYLGRPQDVTPATPAQKPVGVMAPEPQQDLSSVTASQIAGRPVQVEQRPIEPEVPYFKQWESEKELQQEAKSPVFRDNALAQNVLKDREVQEARNPYGYIKELLSGKVIVFSKDGTEPEREFASMNEAQSVLAQQGLKAAPNGLIMPTRESEEAFNKKTLEEQQQIIQGSSGFERSQEKANERRTIGQKAKDFVKTVGGIASNAYDAILQSERLLGAKQRELFSFGERSAPAKENLQRVKQEVIRSMGQIENQYAQDLVANNIQTSLIDAVNSGKLSQLPEAVGYNVANALISGFSAAGTGGYSMFAQTLADEYKNGVENLARETGRTPEQVIAAGDDAELIPTLSAGFQGVLESAQIGLATDALKNRGAYKAIRDAVVKKSGKKAWAAAAGISATAVESGLQGLEQELTSIAAAEAAGSDSASRFYDKLMTTLGSDAGKKRLAESFVGEAIGAGGIVGGGKTAQAVLGAMKRPRVVNSIEDVPVTSQESAVVTEDGKVVYDDIESIDTQPQVGQDKAVTVTPEEFQAYQEGTIDPERQAGLADDVAKGVTPESVAESDPLYARMLENEYAKRQTNDSQNEQGVFSEIGEGQEPVETEPVAQAGEEEVTNGGVVQNPEEAPLDLDAELAALDGLELPEESLPLSDETGENVDVVDAGQEVEASGGESVAAEPGGPEDQGEVVSPVPRSQQESKPLNKGRYYPNRGAEDQVEAYTYISDDQGTTITVFPDGTARGYDGRNGEVIVSPEGQITAEKELPAAAVKRVQKAIEAVKSTPEWQELSGIVKQPAVPLTTGEGKVGQSPIQSFDAAQSLKGEEGRSARKALKESMGKEQYKDLETITNKFPQIAKDLESRGAWKIDCP